MNDFHFELAGSCSFVGMSEKENSRCHHLPVADICPHVKSLLTSRALLWISSSMVELYICMFILYVWQFRALVLIISLSDLSFFFLLFFPYVCIHFFLCSLTPSCLAFPSGVIRSLEAVFYQRGFHFLFSLYYNSPF